MQITYTGHQLEVTPALKEFTSEKLQRILRHFDRIISINITFHVEKLDNIVDATVHIPSHSIHASAKANDMYAAVDELTDKLDRQVKKYKEKEEA
ncbi:MAG: ribosome-associated translation inhibitor RaiA [Gammaproteobacteria bacterium]